MKRGLAAAIATAILFELPGLPFYAAWAASTPAGARITSHGTIVGSAHVIPDVRIGQISLVRASISGHAAFGPAASSNGLNRMPAAVLAAPTASFAFENAAYALSPLRNIAGEDIPVGQHRKTFVTSKKPAHRFPADPKRLLDQIARVGNLWESSRNGAADFESDSDVAAPRTASGPRESLAPATKGASHGSKDEESVPRLDKNLLLFSLGAALNSLGSSVEAVYKGPLFKILLGDPTIGVLLGPISTATEIAGQHASKASVAKHGLWRTYVGARAAGLIYMMTLNSLLGFGLITVPLLAALYAVSGYLTGVIVTVQESIPSASIDKSHTTAQRRELLDEFAVWNQLFTSAISIAALVVAGTLLTHLDHGFGYALLVQPVVRVIVLAWFWATLRIPDESKPTLENVFSGAIGVLRLAADIPLSLGRLSGCLRDAVSDVGETILRCFGDKRQLIKTVFEDDELLTSLLAHNAYFVWGSVLTEVVIFTFALQLAPAGLASAAFIGWLLALYNVGGILGMILRLRGQKRLDARLRDGRTNSAQAAEIGRRSLLNWMGLATAALASIIPLFAMSLPTADLLLNRVLDAFGLQPALPSFANTLLTSLTVQAMALVPLGMALSMVLTKLKSLLQTRVSARQEKESIVRRMAAVQSATTIIQYALMLGLWALFRYHGASTALFLLAAGALPLAVVVQLWLMRRVRNYFSTKPRSEGSR